MRIRVNDQQAQKLFRSLKSKETARHVLVNIGAEMELQIDDSFHRQKSPDGKDWAELSPITKVLRRGSVYHKLVNTSVLRNSFRHAVSGKRLTVGTDWKYAHVHNQGMVIKPKNGPFLKFGRKGAGFFMLRQSTIPQRQFMPAPGENIPRKFAKAAKEAATEVLEALK